MQEADGVHASSAFRVRFRLNCLCEIKARQFLQLCVKVALAASATSQPPDGDADNKNITGQPHLPCYLVHNIMSQTVYWAALTSIRAGKCVTSRV